MYEPKVRWALHVVEAFIKRSNRVLQQNIRQHGIDAFEVKTLHEVTSRVESLRLEKVYIEAWAAYRA